MEVTSDHCYGERRQASAYNESLAPYMRMTADDEAQFLRTKNTLSQRQIAKVGVPNAPDNISRLAYKLFLKKRNVRSDQNMLNAAIMFNRI